MSASRIKRLKLKLNTNQKNVYAAALIKFKDEYGEPRGHVRLWMLERILMGQDPLEGLEQWWNREGQP